MSPADRGLEPADEEDAAAEVADPARLVEVAELEASPGLGADEDEPVADLEPLVLPRRVRPQHERTVRAHVMPVHRRRLGQHHDPTQRELGDGPRRQFDRPVPDVAQLVAKLERRRIRIEPEGDRADETGDRLDGTGQAETGWLDDELEAIGIGHRDEVRVLRARTTGDGRRTARSGRSGSPSRRRASPRGGSRQSPRDPGARCADRPSQGPRPTGARPRAAESGGRGIRRTLGRLPDRPGRAVSPSVALRRHRLERAFDEGLLDVVLDRRSPPAGARGCRASFDRRSAGEPPGPRLPRACG